MVLNTFRQMGAAEPGLRLIAALEWFFYVRGLFAEWVGWLQDFLQATAGHFHPSIAERIAAQEESLALKRKINDRQGIAISLYNLGSLYLQQSNYQAALTTLLKRSGSF